MNNERTYHIGSCNAMDYYIKLVAMHHERACHNACSFSEASFTHIEQWTELPDEMSPKNVKVKYSNVTLSSSVYIRFAYQDLHLRGKRYAIIWNWKDSQSIPNEHYCVMGRSLHSIKRKMVVRIIKAVHVSWMIPSWRNDWSSLHNMWTNPWSSAGRTLRSISMV